MKKNVLFTALFVVSVSLLSACGDSPDKRVSITHKTVVYVEHSVENGDIGGYMAANDTAVNMASREIVMSCPCFLANDTGNWVVGELKLASPENKLILSLPADRTYNVTIWRPGEKHEYYFPPNNVEKK